MVSQLMYQTMSPAGEMPVIRPPAAHAEAFVGVSASAQVPGDIRAQLRLYGIEFQKAAVSGETLRMIRS